MPNSSQMRRTDTPMSEGGGPVSAVQFGAVHVCPLSRVRETLDLTGARHLMTLINRQTMLETPHGIETTNHLKIAINDIIAPQEGLTHASAQHVEEVIAFARVWGRKGPLVVHCWAGISRSTAAAYISLCALNPGVPEKLIAQRLREASAFASPNRLLVQLADDILGRRGKMSDAITLIGPAESAAESIPFRLASSFD